MTDHARFLRALTGWTLLAAGGEPLLDRWIAPETAGPAFLPAALLTLYAGYVGAKVWRRRWPPIGAALASTAAYAVLAWATGRALEAWLGWARPWAPWERPGLVLLNALVLGGIAAGLAASSRTDQARARSTAP
jgi:hypothetical protein